MFLVLIAIQAVLLLYPGATVETTSLWDFVSNTQNWNSTTFILAFVGISTAMGLVGVIAGSAFGFKTDFIIFAAAIQGLLSIGVVMVNFANVLRNELIARFLPGCIDQITGAFCSTSNYLVTVIIGPIAFFYVWTVIEWWRGKDL